MTDKRSQIINRDRFCETIGDYYPMANGDWWPEIKQLLLLALIWVVYGLLWFAWPISFFAIDRFHNHFSHHLLLWWVVFGLIPLGGWLHLWFFSHDVSWWKYWTTAAGFRGGDSIKANDQAYRRRDPLAAALKEFAQQPTAKSLLVTGGWGTGKTFRVREFLASDSIRGCMGHSYVSLFGLSTIDQVTAEILARIDTEDEQPARFLYACGRALFPLVALVAKITSYSAVPDFLTRRFVRNVVIVLDDLERREESLPLRTVLGMIDKLVVENGCKSIVISDDTKLEKDKDLLAEYEEKLVNLSVRYAPKPSDSAWIAFEGGPDLEFEEVFKAFDTTNVRVMRLAKSAVARLMTYIEGMPKEIRSAFISHVVAFTVMRYERLDTNFGVLDQFTEEARITDYSSLSQLPNGKQLYVLGYIYQPYDHFISEFLKYGFIVNEGGLRDALKQCEAAIKEELITEELRTAWKDLKEKNPTTEEEIKQGFFDVYNRNKDWINPSQIIDAARAIKFFDKEFSEERWLREWYNRSILDASLEYQEELLKKFQLLLPPTIRQEFREHIARSRGRHQIADLMEGVATPSDGFREIDFEALRTQSTEAYVDWIMSPGVTPSIVKEARKKLRQLPSQDAILERFEKAMTIVAGKSRLWEIRVEEYMGSKSN